MKSSNVIWGVLLVILGSLFLLENLDILDIEFRKIWKLWPLFLIYWGITALFSGNKNSNTVSLFTGFAMIAIVLYFMITPSNSKTSYNWDEKSENNSSRKSSKYQTFTFEEENDDSITLASLNLDLGAGNFTAKSADNRLIKINTNSNGITYMFDQQKKDDMMKFEFRPSKEIKGKMNFENDVDLYLGSKQIWVIDLNIGASDLDFDLSKNMVEKLEVNAGASDIDIKMGGLLPSATVNVNAGASDIKIKVPKNVGCQIISETGLSSKDFDGFEKTNGGYTTPNFDQATNKIYLQLKGGVSSFSVDQYN